jgi:hypothetical protein
MMGILPDRLDHDQWRIGGQISEHFHPIFLGIDEAVLLYRIDGMSPYGLKTIAFDCRDD